MCTLCACRNHNHIMNIINHPKNEKILQLRAEMINIINQLEELVTPDVLQYAEYTLQFVDDHAESLGVLHLHEDMRDYCKKIPQ